MNLEPVMQSELSQKEKDKYINAYIYGIQKDCTDDPMCRAAKKTQMKRTHFWIQWEKERMG